MFKSDDEASTFLGAMIDGEGSVGMRPIKGTRGYTREVRVTNTDECLIWYCADACDRLGIKYSIYTRTDRSGSLGKKPIHDLVIMHRDSLERLSERVVLRSEAKAAKLKAALSSYIRGNVDPDLLRELTKEGYTQNQIADMLGTAQSNVNYWFKKHGIEARPEGRPATRRPSREDLVAALGSMPLSQVAEHFNASRTAVYRWLKHYGIER